jgi:hypothetical protein
MLKSWEQTQGFIENKGVRGFPGKKQTGFSCKQTRNKLKKQAKKPPFVRPRSGIRDSQGAGGRVRGGYTNIEIDLSRHLKSAERRAPLGLGRPGQDDKKS